MFREKTREFNFRRRCGILPRDMSQTLGTALVALKRNATRSLLTMLGIVIGIAAVIAMMEIGDGAARQIAASISNMGSNVIMVRSVAVQRAGVSAGAGTGISLTGADCDAILADCPSVTAATPSVRGTAVQAIRGAANYQPERVDSGSADFFDVNEWSFDDGAAFTRRDVDSAATVCVLGKTVADALFSGGESPVGARIRLNNVIFTVCGLLKPKGANLMGMDQNDMVVVPWRTMRARLSRSGGTASTGAASASASAHSRSAVYAASSVSLYPSRDATQTANYLMPIRFDNVNNIQCKAASSDKVDSAMEEIRTLLRARHRIPDGEQDDFELRNMSEMLAALTSTSTLMTSLLLIVALISLVVGGVGIMNIMLVSVTERTREIGLRMAVGARGRDILAQFLVESLLLCLCGGVAGIAAGRATSEAISALKGWPVAPSVAAVVVSVAVSAAIGICFGFYPAWRASKLNPIDALHYE